jgi:hypothetical protein
MSGSGQTLRSQSSPTAQFVRCWSDSDHTFAAPRTALRANRRHPRKALQRGALYWKTGLSHALDTALEVIGIFVWQDASLPLD